MPVEGRNGKIIAFFEPPSYHFAHQLASSATFRKSYTLCLQMPQVDTVAAQALLADVGDDGIEGRENLLTSLRQPTAQHHRIGRPPAWRTPRESVAGRPAPSPPRISPPRSPHAIVQLRSLGTAPSYGKQLRELVADGFLARTDFGEVPPRVEYTLTPQGESFVPILLAMKQWGEKELGL